MKRGAYKAKIERELPCREVVLAAYAGKLERQSARIVHRRVVERQTWQAIADGETASGIEHGREFAIYDVQKIFRQAIADLTRYLEAKGTIEHAERKPQIEQFELIP